MITSPPLLPAPLLKDRVPPTPALEITSPASTEVIDPNIALAAPLAIDTDPDSPEALSPLLTNKDPEPPNDFPLSIVNSPDLTAPSADFSVTSPDVCRRLSPLTILMEPPFSESPRPAAIDTSDPTAPDPDDRINIPPTTLTEFVLEPTDNTKSPDDPSIAFPVETCTLSLDTPLLLPTITDPLRPLPLTPLTNSTLPPTPEEGEAPPRTVTLPPTLLEEPPTTNTSPPTLPADSPPDIVTAPPTNEPAPEPAEITT
jgi:hypothetical protein